jgi:hypothetical protein
MNASNSETLETECIRTVCDRHAGSRMASLFSCCASKPFVVWTRGVSGGVFLGKIGNLYYQCRNSWIPGISFVLLYVLVLVPVWDILFSVPSCRLRQKAVLGSWCLSGVRLSGESGVGFYNLCRTLFLAAASNVLLVRSR